MNKKEVKKKAVIINVTAAPNSGKTALTEFLFNYYKNKGLKVKRVKYPVYSPKDYGAVDYEETGKRINAYIREGNPENWDVRTAQHFYAKNREYFDIMIKKWQEEEDIIITEDGKHTSIIWGPIMDKNLKREEIEEWNKNIIEADIHFTLRGPRLGGIETVHKFENSGQWLECRNAHLVLAEELNWKIIDFEKKEGEDEIKKETERVAFIIIKESEYLFK